MHSPTEEEALRLQHALEAAYAVPFIADVEGYVWEAILAYVKNVPFIDPLHDKRKKALFDVVDDARHIGWSAKTLLWPTLITGCQFELVIQRADIFKKHAALGFEKLSVDTPTDVLGAALLKHWEAKVIQDAKIQGVRDGRISILLKSLNRTSFAMVEEPVVEYSPADLTWKWTNPTRTGLQGIRKADGFVAYRWYPNQKQLFERFELCTDAHRVKLNPKRLPPQDAVDFLRSALDNIDV